MWPNGTKIKDFLPGFELLMRKARLCAYRSMLITINYLEHISASKLYKIHYFDNNILATYKLVLFLFIKTRKTFSFSNKNYFTCHHEN